MLFATLYLLAPHHLHKVSIHANFGTNVPICMVFVLKYHNAQKRKVVL